MIKRKPNDKKRKRELNNEKTREDEEGSKEDLFKKNWIRWPVKGKRSKEKEKNK